MSRPAISVIVPFHNAAATLGDAIESLAASSCREIEVLAVDDASTDCGGEIVRGFAARDARFRCLRNPANRGVSFSRNRGLDEAAGDRLAFVDADDRVSPDWLAHLLADARESGAEVVIGRSRRVCGGTESVYRMEGLRRRGSLDFRQIVFKDNSVVWNKLYAASLIRRLRLRFDESLSIGEDLLFNFQALHAARGIFYGGRGSYLHRADNPSSLMRGTDPAGRVAQYARLLERLDAAARAAGLPRHPVLRKVARDLLMDHYRSGTPPPDPATLALIRGLSATLPFRVRASVFRKNLRRRLAGRPPTPA